jgi:hypothetical protein
MDDRAPQEKDDKRVDEPEGARAVEDMDVPEEDSEDVKGGTYSFKQGWPKKYSG